MHSSTLLALTAVALAIVAPSASAHTASSNHLARRHAHAHPKRSPAAHGAFAGQPKKKRACKPRNNGNQDQGQQNQDWNNNGGGNQQGAQQQSQNWQQPQDQGQASQDPVQNVVDHIASGVQGLLSIADTHCGDPRATSDITTSSGPNGHIDFLNCGLNNGGWNPPHVTVNDLKYKALDQAITEPNSPFTACSDYVGLFDQYGKEFGLPPIMLASFAMQESTCNPNVVGGGGEEGLMQLTHDKCGDAPGGNCKEPWYNIRTAAKFFRDTLDGNGGNILLAIGQYNGWQSGLTYDKATAAASSSCCRCQNNLDYLHQFCNGWLQNQDVYSGAVKLGVYFNLNVC